MTRKELRQIDVNLDYLWNLYDKANMMGDIRKMKEVKFRIDKELSKLDENEVKIDSTTLH